MSPPGAGTWEGIDEPIAWADSGSGGLEPGIVAATRPPGTNPPLYSPENPLFWLGVLGLLGTGAIFVSAHWKVGSEKGSVSV